MLVIPLLRRPLPAADGPRSPEVSLVMSEPISAGRRRPLHHLPTVSANL